MGTNIYSKLSAKQLVDVSSYESQTDNSKCIFVFSYLCPALFFLWERGWGQFQWGPFHLSSEGHPAKIETSVPLLCYFIIILSWSQSTLASPSLNSKGEGVSREEGVCTLHI